MRQAPILGPVWKLDEKRTGGEALIFYLAYAGFALVGSSAIAVVADPFGMGLDLVLAFLGFDLALPIFLTVLLIRVKRLSGSAYASILAIPVLAALLGFLTALIVPAILTRVSPRATA